MSIEITTLGVQVMGILSRLSGLGRVVDQTRKSPSGHLLITDQPPLVTPWSSQMICRSRMFQSKCSPVWGGCLADTHLWIACARHSLFRQLRRPKQKQSLHMGSQLVKKKNQRDVTLSFLEQFILLTYDINKIMENKNNNNNKRNTVGYLNSSPENKKRFTNYNTDPTQKTPQNSE